MGDTGPCGPCSEIFYDHGDGVPGGPPGSPDEDGDRFIEIWNLVFMQFEQLRRASACRCRGRRSTPAWGSNASPRCCRASTTITTSTCSAALILASAEASGVAADGPQAVSHRVIADHLRASAFLIADGVLPSKDGRGYVLRRIMRRAMRHAQMLGCKEPLMWRLVPALVQQMGAAYPELLRAQPLITETLRLEEEGFRQTLGRGLRAARGRWPRGKGLKDGKTLDGERRFHALRHLRLSARPDAGHFAAARHRRRQSTGSIRQMDAGPRPLARLLGRLGRGGDRGDMVRAARGGRGHRVPRLRDRERRGRHARDPARRRARSSRPRAGDEVGIVVNQTPFYAESGGQVGDTGAIFSASGGELAVRDTAKKAGDLHVHLGTVTHGTLKIGDAVELRVDGDRRRRLRANHSVTHLLHRRCATASASM